MGLYICHGNKKKEWKYTRTLKKSWNTPEFPFVSLVWQVVPYLDAPDRSWEHSRSLFSHCTEWEALALFFFSRSGSIKLFPDARVSRSTITEWTLHVLLGALNFFRRERQQNFCRLALSEQDTRTAEGHWGRTRWKRPLEVETHRELPRTCSNAQARHAAESVPL